MADQQTGSAGHQCPAAPRLYALDMIIPADGPGCGEPIVLDVNGARCGTKAARALYGDDRVHEEILTRLAHHANGVICSVSQATSSPAQEKFSARRLRRAIGVNCGWYDLADKHAPTQESYESDQHIERMARRLGIDYRRYTVDWRPNRGFVIAQGNMPPVPLSEWEPDGIIWPFSWDQRALPLPRNSSVCNSSIYARATTNKLLPPLLLRDDRRLAPTHLVGLWRNDSPRLTRTCQRLVQSPLIVVKPLQGWRGYGVLAASTAELPGWFQKAGLVAKTDELLELAAEATMAALLWGSAHELLGLAQPYVEPRLVTHPRTGLPHNSMLRATVIAENDRAECIDLCQPLSAKPSTFGQSRASLLVCHSDETTVVAPENSVQLIAAAVAENFVNDLEAGARRLLAGDSLGAELQAETALMLSALDVSSDINAVERWRGFDRAATICDALGT